MKSFPKICIIFLTLSGIFLFIGSCGNKSPETIITTYEVKGITRTGAVSGGNIKTDRRGRIVARGICWATKTDPALADNFTNEGTGAGDFLSTMTSLQPGTDYYVRAYAISETDTIFGRNISFTTQDYETLTDIEGNTYNIISIGEQAWMAENLATGKYNDGTAIPLVKDEKTWVRLSSPGYTWYKNEEDTFKPTYGTLYNWYAVNTGKLCPTGWHVPGDEEWNILTGILGGEDIAGGRLKATGSTYWVEPNTGATNEYGFTAFPGGFRYRDGKFFDFGFSGYWWTSGEYSASRAYFRFMYFEDTKVYRFDNDKKNGFSVRCVKD